MAGMLLRSIAAPSIADKDRFIFFIRLPPDLFPGFYRQRCGVRLCAPASFYLSSDLIIADPFGNRNAYFSQNHYGLYFPAQILHVFGANHHCKSQRIMV